MRDYTNLNVWKKSHDLALLTYRLSSEFPSSEKFGITAQMRRAASSIPSNIAEGAGRRTTADYRKFIDIAAGSAGELEYQLFLVLDLGFVTDAQTKQLRELAGEIKKMLRSLSNRLTPPPNG